MRRASRVRCDGREWTLNDVCVVSATGTHAIDGREPYAMLTGLDGDGLLHVHRSTASRNAREAPHESRKVLVSRVLDVRPGPSDRQSHWTVAGPAGIPIEFDAAISAFIPHETLGWRTLDGSVVAHAGLVQFEPAGDGRTRVQIRMSYNPPGGGSDTVSPQRSASIRKAVSMLTSCE
jgi:hypothetical protein